MQFNEILLKAGRGEVVDGGPVGGYDDLVVGGLSSRLDVAGWSGGGAKSP